MSKKDGSKFPERAPVSVEFERVGSQRVVACFDGGVLGSDGGGMLLRELGDRLQLFERLAACFADHRDPERVQHPVVQLVAARVLALALGYEDLNDHDELRRSRLWALLCRSPARQRGGGGRRKRRRGGRAGGTDWDRLPPGKSTLNRMELTAAACAAEERYKKIVADTDKLDALLVELGLEGHAAEPERIVLDVDATDDPLHGQQEGRFYHGYYQEYVYLPLYVFWGRRVLCARLREANRDPAAGVEEELERIVEQIRKRWPTVPVVLRGDSGFCRESVLDWCERHGVEYVLGLRKNSRLTEIVADEQEQARQESERTGEAARVFKDFRYRTLDSWSRERRVVAKAEHLPCKANPRFVVTSLSAEEVGARELYEDLYCARGEMENRIKEQQLDLFADRTSTQKMRANQLRLYLSSFAYALVEAFRRLALAGTQYARAQCGTIRLRLFKIGVRIRVAARVVRLAFDEGFPDAQLVGQALARIQGLPRRC